MKVSADKQDLRVDAQGKRLLEDRCPSCNHKLDAATNADARDDARPNPGDLCVCAHCGEIAAYTETMELRVLSLGELLDLPHEVIRPALMARQYVRNRTA